jgi:hypothetical protein
MYSRLMRAYPGLTPLQIERFTDDQLFLMAIDEKEIISLGGKIVNLTPGQLKREHGVRLATYGPDGIGTGSWSKCQYLWYLAGQKEKKLAKKQKRDRRRGRKRS